MPTTYSAYKIELEFKPDGFGGSIASIHATSPIEDASLSLTPACVNITELRTQVEGLKQKLDKAVASAERKFRNPLK